MKKNYSYEIFEWQKKTFIQEFENNQKVNGAYVPLSKVTNTNNTYYSKSDLHYRVRNWLKENYPEMLI